MYKKFHQRGSLLAHSSNISIMMTENIFPLKFHNIKNSPKNFFTLEKQNLTGLISDSSLYFKSLVLLFLYKFHPSSLQFLIIWSHFLVPYRFDLMRFYCIAVWMLKSKGTLWRFVLWSEILAISHPTCDCIPIPTKFYPDFDFSLGQHCYTALKVKLNNCFILRLIVDSHELLSCYCIGILTLVIKWVIHMTHTEAPKIWRLGDWYCM